MTLFEKDEIHDIYYDPYYKALVLRGCDLTFFILDRCIERVSEKPVSVVIKELNNRFKGVFFKKFETADAFLSFLGQGGFQIRGLSAQQKSYIESKLGRVWNTD